MKRLVQVLIGLGLIWSAYWYAAGYGLRTGIAAWFNAREAAGWQAELADISTSGFPITHVNLLTSPALADPATGTAWRADWISLESPAIWPGRQTMRFPATPQRLSYFDKTTVITAQDLAAELHLHPGIALEVQRMALSSGPWEIAFGDNPAEVLAGEPLTLSMVQTAQPETYRYAIDAPGFTPGKGLRDLVPSGAMLPAGFEALKIEADVTFDRVWDRRALEERRPQPVAIDLDLADMRWGGMLLKATGEVTVDGQGIPTGTITVKAENWREMLRLVQAAWGVPQSAANTVEGALDLLARMGGNPNYLDVQLSFQDGGMSVGPIPLGSAPRLFLH